MAVRKTGLNEAIRNGDVTAFEFFFRAEYDNVVHFLMRYVKDILMAQDIAQDSFIVLWQNREKIKVAENLRAYVFTIAKNRAINEMALKINKSRSDIERKEVRLFIDALSSEYVSSSIESLEITSLISKVYSDLSDNVLESFIMNREKGYTYREIAERKGVSQKVVEYHIKVALGNLRKKLKDYMLILLPFF